MEDRYGREYYFTWEEIALIKESLIVNADKINEDSRFIYGEEQTLLDVKIKKLKDLNSEIDLD